MRLGGGRLQPRACSTAPIAYRGFGCRAPGSPLADVKHQNYTHVVDQHIPSPLLSVS